jgi:hypothetical protein
MGKAAASDKEFQSERLCHMLSESTASVEEILLVDYNATWARIAGDMEGAGGCKRWTAEKVKYAWNHGVSDRFPHIDLCADSLLSF